MTQNVKRNCMYFAITFLVSCATLFLQSAVVHASEIELESNTEDNYQNERLNSLEIRLEELGYTINDMQVTVESIQEELQINAEQRLFIGQQLDLVIIGLRDLCNYNIELLGKLDLDILQATAFQESVITALDDNNKAIKHLSENTVSGNTLVTTTLSEGNLFDSQNFETVITLILIGFGIVIGVISATALFRSLKHE